MIRLLLFPFAVLYSLIVGARNFLYNRGWLRSYAVGVPVVSVGNITAGGTGKTPFTAMLVQELQRRGHRPAIVSRGYKGLVSGVEKVSVPAGAEGLTSAAVRFGDEPSWYASHLPGVPVYVGADRVAACRELVARENPSIIIADDAFQHRRLRRDIDIVLLDATESTLGYLPLPAGRGREPFRSLLRAHAVVLTKCNLAEPGALRGLRSGVRRLFEERHDALVHETGYVVAGLESLDGARRLEARERSGESAYLVSGIARPATFAELARTGTGLNVVAHEAFADHHAFTAPELREIEERARRSGARNVLVTAKDAVKMRSWRPQGLDVWIVNLRLEPLTSLEPLYALLAGKAL